MKLSCFITLNVRTMIRPQLRLLPFQEQSHMRLRLLRLSFDRILKSPTIILYMPNISIILRSIPVHAQIFTKNNIYNYNTKNKKVKLILDRLSNKHRLQSHPIPYHIVYHYQVQVLCLYHKLLRFPHQNIFLHVIPPRYVYRL